MTAQEFAEEHGFNANTLTYWSWKFNKELRESEARKPTEHRVQPEPASHFGGDQPDPSALQFVQVLQALPSSVDSDRIEVVLAVGVTVRVPSSFDDDALRRLLDVLEDR